MDIDMVYSFLYNVDAARMNVLACETERLIMVVDQSEVTEATAADTGASDSDNDSESNEKTTTQVMFVVPNELKQMIDEQADKEGKSTSAWLRGLVAEEFDYELPLSIITRAKKYANDDERKAAQAAKAKTRNDLLKKLLAAYRAGEIDLDEDDLATDD